MALSSPAIRNDLAEDPSDSDDDISSDEFFRRLESLETNQTETAQLLQQTIQERFRVLRQEVEEMRKHLIEQGSKRQRRLQKKVKKLKLRQSSASAVLVDGMPAEEPSSSQSSQSAKQQLARESRKSSAIRAPAPAPAPVAEQDEDEAMALAPLQLDYEELPPPPPAKAESSPAPVAPMAVSAGVPSPTSSSGMKRPQRAKCSVKRAKHTGFGSAPGSRVQSDIEAQVSSPPAPKPSRPGVSMARRSRLTRAGGGVSRAEVAARNKNDAPATFTPVNKQTLETGRPLFVDTDRSESPEPAQPTSRETNKPGIPEKPLLFSQQVIRDTFGGGKITSPIWKIPPTAKNSFKKKWTYMVICNESSVELPERFMDPGAILDLCEWEIAGELNCDTNVEFPVFVKKGEDKFLYCGIYKFGEWDVVPVKTWEKLSDAVKKYWCRHVITSTAGVSMLNEQGLKPPGAARKFLPKEIEEFFLEDLDREEKGGLRLSRTEICPIRSEANVYKTLCKTHEKKTHPQPPNTTAPSAGASSRNQKRPSTVGGSGSKSGKRIRLEKEPADKDTIEFPFERMSPRRTRTSDVNYNLVTMSKKDLAESGLVSDSSEDDEDVVQKFVTRRKALTAGRASMDADDGESSEEE